VIRVLLIDFAIIRDGIKQILADTGDLLVGGEAADGAEALRLLAQQGWDLVVLDIAILHSGGLELISRIRRADPLLPILVFSMNREEHYALRVLQAGASGFLTKESDSELLVAAMRKVAAGGVHVSDKVAKLLVHEYTRGTDKVAYVSWISPLRATRIEATAAGDRRHGV